eukprot:s2707_g5.t1
MTPIRFEIRIEQLKDIFDEWSRERPDGSEISRAAILRRTELVQILKDILASFEGGEESDASEVSDSVPSDDGSDAMSVEEGDAETLPTGTLLFPGPGVLHVWVAWFTHMLIFVAGSPGELTALELEELFGIHLSIDMYMCCFVLREDVEPAIPSEHDDVDQGRSSEQDSFRGCTKIQFYTLQA